MRVLISGGCKMGKSTLAQQLTLAQGGRAVYVATMKPRDAEDIARIIRHRRERMGMGFATLECPMGIEQVVGAVEADASLLLDSTTALLAEEMFKEHPDFFEIDAAAPMRVSKELLAVADCFENIVFVSDAIYADGAQYNQSSEAYRSGLALIDRTLARRCDAVIEMAIGQCILHKGDERVAAWIAQVIADIGDGAGFVHGAAGFRPVG